MIGLIFIHTVIIGTTERVQMIYEDKILLFEIHIIYSNILHLVLVKYISIRNNLK